MGVYKPTGVILAGGQSSRMGGGHKALLPLNGRPLLRHVVDRLQPQLGALLLSLECRINEFDSFGLPLVPDRSSRYQGPLMGLFSVLQYLHEQGQDNSLVLCPCDAPFVPTDVVSKLADAGHGDQRPVVVISYQGVLQPTFSLWQSHHLPVIHEAVVNQGRGGIKRLLASLPHKVVEWPESEPPPFFNVNTPADLETAEGWLG